MRKLVCLALAFLMVAGCTVGPNYKRPAVTTPVTYYTDPSPQSNAIADLSWWELFKDPVLQSLIQEALKNNYDVRIAAARVEEERAQIGVTRSQFFPQIGYGASIAGQRAPTIPNHTYYGYDLNLSWEIDLWGRIRRMNEQQRAVFLATEEAQRGVWLSLASDVAQAYFELRALDALLEIAVQTGQSFQETLDLFNKQLEGGTASGLETSRAGAALDNVLAQVPDLRRQITAKENQINLLLGRNPGPIPRGALLSQQNDLDVVPAGLPSTLLERRPDLRQAEQEMVAANAAVGVAKANFFPVLSLTALLGAVSPQLSGLVSSGTEWGVAGGLAGPLFTGGRLKSQYRAAQARWDQARFFYLGVATNAFGEVSTALSAHEELAESLKKEASSVRQYQDSVRLANTRYDSGLSSYFEVIDAKLDLYPAQQFEVQYDLERKTALVNLYKALGGGWKLSDLDWVNVPLNARPGSTHP
jgi:outer membrane protein, multidrug efflux system